MVAGFESSQDVESFKSPVRLKTFGVFRFLTQFPKKYFRIDKKMQKKRIFYPIKIYLYAFNFLLNGNRSEIFAANDRQ
jgi:hypothetical protein